jgi:hypothetical protein
MHREMKKKKKVPQRLAAVRVRWHALVAVPNRRISVLTALHMMLVICKSTPNMS